MIDQRWQPGKPWPEDTSKPITIGEYASTKGKPHPRETEQKFDPYTGVPPSDFKKRMPIADPYTGPGNQGVKRDEGKTRMELFPPEFFNAVSKVLTFGAKEYAPHNWRKGLAYSRVVGAILRHLFAFLSGKKTDPDSGLPHLWHLGCNVAFLVSFENDRDKYASFDDLPRIGGKK